MLPSDARFAIHWACAMSANMLFRTWSAPDRTLKVVLSLHRKEAPSDEAWDGYIAAFVQALAEVQGDSRRIRGLAISDGGGPTSKQRDRLNSFMRNMTEGRGTVAIVTADPIVRGIVKALSWFNPMARAFAPTELSRAIDYLGLTPVQRLHFEPALDQALSAYPVECVRASRRPAQWR